MAVAFRVCLFSPLYCWYAARGAVPSVFALAGVVASCALKPVLNWANVCSPEHTSDTSTNYDSFLN